MTEDTSPAVGRASIDAYLDLVEQALMAANAPRGDRLQVLQDLESQIADMLAREPSPLTEESVSRVLNMLEPPDHFAANYGNGRQSSAPTPGRNVRMPRVGWAMIAAASCALFSVASLLAVFAAAADARDLFDLLVILVLLGFVLTPIALWMAYRQLRANPGMSGRDLVLKSTAVYAAVASTLLILFISVITGGFALLTLGVAAFIYFEYHLIRRVWRHMAGVLPPQSASAKTGDANGRGATSPVSPATPMPAM